MELVDPARLPIASKVHVTDQNDYPISTSSRHVMFIIGGFIQFLSWAA
jgi:hypothetical protein